MLDLLSLLKSGEKQEYEMLPKSHIIINFFIDGIFLFFINPIYVVIIFLSSILIDIDHYFYYIFEKKNLSLKKGIKWYLLKRKQFHNLSREEKKKHKYFVFIFHGVESIILLSILSMYFPILIYVVIGFSIHLIEDLIVAGKFKYIERKLFLSYAIYLHKKNKVK